MTAVDFSAWARVTDAQSRDEASDLEYWASLACDAAFLGLRDGGGQFTRASAVRLAEAMWLQAMAHNIRRALAARRISGRT